jgi:hypothetical protein
MTESSTTTSTAPTCRQWLRVTTRRQRPGQSPAPLVLRELQRVRSLRAHGIRLVCLDDDGFDPKRSRPPLDGPLGPRARAPAVALVRLPSETHGLARRRPSAPRSIHPSCAPRASHFGAYLHALKWSAVSAADATRFQAPFRAGIKLMAHQLTPLMKALELPRANLFIADDVGLGKTIEAGPRPAGAHPPPAGGFVLIVCPASVSLQWRDEMQRRFGLHFEVMTRQFIAYRRQRARLRREPVGHAQPLHRLAPADPPPEYREPAARPPRPPRTQRASSSSTRRTSRRPPREASTRSTATSPARSATSRRASTTASSSAPPRTTATPTASARSSRSSTRSASPAASRCGQGGSRPIMVRRLKRDLRQLGVERFPRSASSCSTPSSTRARHGAPRTGCDAETGTARAEPFADGPGRAPRARARHSSLATPSCARPSSRPRPPPFHQPAAAPPLEPRGLRAHLEAHAAGRLEGRGRRARAEGQARCPARGPSTIEADPETHGPTTTRPSPPMTTPSLASPQRRSCRRPPKRPRPARTSMRALAERPAVSRTRRCEPCSRGCGSTVPRHRPRRHRPRAKPAPGHRSPRPDLHRVRPTPSATCWSCSRGHRHTDRADERILHVPRRHGRRGARRGAARLQRRARGRTPCASSSPPTPRARASTSRPLRRPLPHRPPVEPRAPRAAQRPHRPHAAARARGALPLLRLSRARRGSRARDARAQDRHRPARARLARRRALLDADRSVPSRTASPARHAPPDRRTSARRRPNTKTVDAELEEPRARPRALAPRSTRAAAAGVVQKSLEVSPEPARRRRHRPALAGAAGLVEHGKTRTVRPRSAARARSLVGA